MGARSPDEAHFGVSGGAVGSQPVAQDAPLPRAAWRGGRRKGEVAAGLFPGCRAWDGDQWHWAAAHQHGQTPRAGLVAIHVPLEATDRDGSGPFLALQHRASRARQHRWLCHHHPGAERILPQRRCETAPFPAAAAKAPARLRA